jgi:hypothetical protein
MANGKVIKFGESAQEKIIEGVELAANAIARTLGPAGRGVSLGLDLVHLRLREMVLQWLSSLHSQTLC